MILNPNGCDLSRLRYKARQALWYLEHVFEIQGEHLTIFHTFDAIHEKGSLHYKNRAFDCGPPLRDRAGTLARVKEAMGPDYDLIDEGDHWHVEYDPK